FRDHAHHVAAAAAIVEEAVYGSHQEALRRIAAEVAKKLFEVAERRAQLRCARRHRGKGGQHVGGNLAVVGRGGGESSGGNLVGVVVGDGDAGSGGAIDFHLGAGLVDRVDGQIENRLGPVTGANARAGQLGQRLVDGIGNDSDESRGAGAHTGN